MIINQKDFCMHVETQFASTTTTMIDTVLEACEEFNVDPELVEPLINRSLKEKMRNEYVDLNYLKNENTIIV